VFRVRTKGFVWLWESAHCPLWPSFQQFFIHFCHGATVSHMIAPTLQLEISNGEDIFLARETHSISHKERNGHGNRWSEQVKRWSPMQIDLILVRPERPGADRSVIRTRGSHGVWAAPSVFHRRTPEEQMVGTTLGRLLLQGAPNEIGACAYFADRPIHITPWTKADVHRLPKLDD